MFHSQIQQVLYLIRCNIIDDDAPTLSLKTTDFVRSRKWMRNFEVRSRTLSQDK